MLYRNFREALAFKVIMSRLPIRMKPVVKKRLKSGENYYLFSFDGQSYTINYGKLSSRKPQSNYVFRGEGTVYKYIDGADIKNTQTGQPLRPTIHKGRLTFIALFVSEEDAKSVAETLPKMVAILLIKNSIDKDKKVIAQLKESMMDRISMMNDVILSKDIEEMATGIKKSATDIRKL